MTKAAPAAGGIQVLRRVSEILRFVAVHNHGGARLTDVASALKLERPTAHRLLQGLVDERMLARDHASKRYVLGPDICELGLMAGGHFGVLDFFRPSIARLVETTGDTVVLTVRSGNNGVCVERRSGVFPIQANTVPIGARRPLAAGAGGLAILSALPEAECERIIAENVPRLRHVPGNSIALSRRQVRKARETGFLLHEILHTAPRITAVSVAVFGSYGAPLAGLSVRSLASRVNGSRRAQIVALLKKEAAAITRALAEENGTPADSRAERAAF